MSASAEPSAEDRQAMRPPAWEDAPIRLQKDTAVAAAKPWTAVSCAHDRQLAANAHLSLDLRMLSAIRGRLSFGGHAHFATGELAQMLNTSDRHVRRTLEQLRDAGAITAQSWARCVRVPPQRASATGQASICPGPKRGSTDNIDATAQRIDELKELALST